MNCKTENKYNINIDNITYIIKRKQSHYKKLTKIFRQGAIFLVFSFINSFFPIFICCLSALIPSYGAQVVTGIGYAATFQLSFAQLGITFAISLFFLFNIKKKSFDNDNDNFIRSLFFTFVIGFVSAFIYILSSYLYLEFSNNRPNTHQTIEYGLDFVYSSAGFCLLSSIEAYVFLLMCRRRKYIIISFFLLRSGIMLLLAYVFAIPAKLEAIGIGLSLTVGILISTVPTLIYVIYKYRYKLFKKVKFFPRGQHLFRRIAQESVPGISLSLAKGIAILCLNLLMTAKLTSYIPLSYQMARVLWFNIMYSIPWLGLGLSDAIKYNDLYNVEHNKFESKQFLIKTYWILFLVSMIIATLFAITEYFMVLPLTELYITNDHYIGAIPEIEGLTPELEQIFMSCLPPTDFPPINHNESLDSYIVKLLHDPQWSKWIKELNAKMGTGGIKDWFENWIALGNNLDAFKKWFVDYISSTSYNADIIQALIIYKTPDEVNHITTPLLLAFKNANFSAKTYIYICIYGIFCSGWSVLLPASSVIDREFPPLLIGLIYFISITWIVGFGSIFSITPVAEKLGTNNPFRYLDAWTFPVSIVAICVFFVIVLKWTIVSIKVYKHPNKPREEKNFFDLLFKKSKKSKKPIEIKNE